MAAAVCPSCQAYTSTHTGFCDVCRRPLQGAPLVNAEPPAAPAPYTTYGLPPPVYGPPPAAYPTLYGPAYAPPPGFAPGFPPGYAPAYGAPPGSLSPSRT